MRRQVFVEDKGWRKTKEVSMKESDEPGNEKRENVVFKG
jgi:hypothetical protein